MSAQLAQAPIESTDLIEVQLNEEELMPAAIASQRLDELLGRRLASALPLLCELVRPVSPATKASSIARPLLPRMSLTNVVSSASSSGFWMRCALRGNLAHQLLASAYQRAQILD